MIELVFDRKHRVLLVRFSVAVTRENLMHFDGLLLSFIAHHGATDVILDFTGAPATEIPTNLMRERAQRTTLVPGKRRVFVAPSDVVFGLLRLFSAHQGSDSPVVRTLGEAFTLLQLDDPTFESVEF